LLVVPALLIGAAGAWATVRSAPTLGLGVRRSVLLTAMIFYITALEGLWPIETRQDYLPWYPMVAVLAGALIGVLCEAGAATIGGPADRGEPGPDTRRRHRSRPPLVPLML